MIKLIQAQSDGNVYLTALVEDGMFEKKLYYPVALFAQMLWDCNADLKDLICDTALCDNIEFI